MEQRLANHHHHASMVVAVLMARGLADRPAASG